MPIFSLRHLCADSDNHPQLTMVDLATGWTECVPLVNRDGRLVIEAIKRTQSYVPLAVEGLSGVARRWMA
jgi:hypothetical protein